MTTSATTATALLASEIQRQWWTGVCQWYNHQDYLRAMETWWDAVQRMPTNNSYARSDAWNTHRYSLPTDATSGDDYNDDSDDNDPNMVWMAPLLLFLAGCYLDGADYPRARWLLKRCLLLCTSIITVKRVSIAEIFGADSTLLQRVLSEYASCAQEDPTVQEPWLVARRAAEWSMERSKASSSSIISTSSPSRHCLLLWKDPYQRPAYFSPAVTDPQPVYAAANEQPAWCHELAAHWTVIRDEYLRLADAGPSTASTSITTTTSTSSSTPTHWPVVGAGDHRDGAGAHDGTVLAAGGDWREWVLFGSGAQPNAAPRTAALLRAYAGPAVDLAAHGGGEIIFSVLAPRTHIQPHTAGTNLRLTAHLGLVVPPECSMRVGDTWIGWQEGQCTVFDDSYEHEVRNDSDSPRAVLLMRFWHPNLPIDERSQVLAQALQSKQDDRLRRYNPPMVNGNVEDRGMERTRCSHCWQTGFETIRVAELGDRHALVCACGNAIIQDAR